MTFTLGSSCYGGQDYIYFGRSNTEYLWSLFVNRPIMIPFACDVALFNCCGSFRFNIHAGHENSLRVITE